jgi:hypothetical protein
MAQQQPVARKQSRLKRDTRENAGSGADRNGHADEMATYEQELADYLQQRIKPGLNRGAIPLLARSIAHEVAQWESPNGEAAQDQADDEPEDEMDDDVDAEADDEPEAEMEDDADAEEDDEPEAETEDDADAEADDEPDAEAEADDDFEADMRDLQAEFGEDWILRFSVQGDDSWLTAEKDDGSQRVEAPNASVLAKAVKLLNKAGGRSD